MQMGKHVPRREVGRDAPRKCAAGYSFRRLELPEIPPLE